MNMRLDMTLQDCTSVAEDSPAYQHMAVYCYDDEATNGHDNFDSWPAVCELSDSLRKFWRA